MFTVIKGKLLALGRRIFHAIPFGSRFVLAIAAGFVAINLVLSPLLKRLASYRRKRALMRRKSERIPFTLKFIEKIVSSGGPRNRTVRSRLATLLATAGSQYLAKDGELALASKCYTLSMQLTPVCSSRAIHNCRTLGATLFMHGRLEQAHQAFEAAGLSRRLLLRSGRVSPRIRGLGDAWFVAIGHIAMLDFYVKKRSLGWGPEAQKIAVTQSLHNTPGKTLAYQFEKFGIDFIYPRGMNYYYDHNRDWSETKWAMLEEDERRAAIDEFWEYDFPDGEILTYTHAAAKVQQRWEAEGHKPLLTLDAEKRSVVDQLLRQMEIPKSVWFVCLHVREAGFHKKWNDIYPTVRDAKIDDYLLAIRSIVDRGGWVIRMGDRSMQPLPTMEGVVDYAHSNLKCEIGDIVLPAACRFFLGTNSGYATVPGIYGVPSVLTNWVPVALPLWFGQDLMIPKMFWDESEQRYYSFEELFSTPMGAMQNIADFPKNVQVRNNTPEEITEVVLEMIARSDGEISYSDHDHALQEEYFRLALKYGSYKGSRLGREFLRKHQALLPQSKAEPEPIPALELAQ